MAQTQDGKEKAAATLKRKYGDDYFSRIGEIGGKTTRNRPRYFATLSSERLKEISKKAHEAKAKKKQLE